MAALVARRGLAIRVVVSNATKTNDSKQQMNAWHKMEASR